MGEEKAPSAGLNAFRFESSAVPFDGCVVVSEMKSVCTPVDLRVDLCEPWFSQDQVVFLERVKDGVEVVGVAVAFNGDVDSVVGDGG